MGRNAVNYLARSWVSRMQEAQHLRGILAKPIPSVGAHGKKCKNALFCRVFCTIKAELVYGAGCHATPQTNLGLFVGRGLVPL